MRRNYKPSFQDYKSFGILGRAIMKNILLYTDTVQRGGAELQMFLLAKFLDKQKFTPILACSNNPSLDKLCKNFQKEEIKVIRLEVRHKHDPRHYSMLKKLIKDEKIDILHAHIWNPASCRYAYLVAKSTKIPLITTEHDPFKLNFFKDAFKKRAINHVSKIITVSENNKKILAKLYPTQKSKIKVILNGIDVTWWKSQLLRFTEEDFKKIKKEVFNAEEKSLIIISIAELHERKGLKYLIKAMPEVIVKFPNIKLVIVGEGPERSELENLIKKLNLENKVILLGQKKDIPKLLKSSDIFALPSIREAFGLVNLEAMLTPLPIIATKVGGIPEIVNDKKTGILVEPESEKSLSETLIKLLSSPKTRQKMATEGQKRVIELFDAKKMAEKYEDIYKKY